LLDINVSYLTISLRNFLSSLGTVRRIPYILKVMGNQ
jgi:hypothetical protein